MTPKTLRIPGRWYLFGIVILANFFSCSSSGRQQPGMDSLKSKTVAGTPLPFAGVWLNDTYIEKIKSAGSLLCAHGRMELLIFPATIPGEVGMEDNFHEGGMSLSLVKEGKNFQVENPNRKKTFLPIVILSASRMKIGTRSFTRIDNPDSTSYDHGVLEQVLFMGRYLDGSGHEVRFMPDGSVLGLDTTRFYHPQTDYIDETDTLDHIFLGSVRENRTQYGFRFDKDTLEIFNLICIEYDSASNTCSKTGRGNTCLTLIRQR